MKCHMTSLFRRMLNPDESLVISRTNRSFGFFLRECHNDVTRTKEGDLIVRYEREEKTPKSTRTPQSSSKIIRMSDDLYSFFLNEYRQNSPVRDQFGNIIISEDLMAKRFR